MFFQWQTLILPLPQHHQLSRAYVHARLVVCRGNKGALIEGIQYRKKGSKHSIADKQAWWCEAPPRTKLLLDHEARVLAAEKSYEERLRRWDSAT